MIELWVREMKLVWTDAKSVSVCEKSIDDLLKTDLVEQRTVFLVECLENLLSPTGCLDSIQPPC